MIPSYWINGAASDDSILCDRLKFLFKCDSESIDSPICTLPNDNEYKLTGDMVKIGWDFPVVGPGYFFNIKPTLVELNIQFFGPGELVFNLPSEIDTAMNSWLIPELDHEYEITE
jgi:hypothetical protein